MDLQRSRPAATMSESYVGEVNNQADDKIVESEVAARRGRRRNVRDRDGIARPAIVIWTTSAD
jgi:hypothetical protein